MGFYSIPTPSLSHPIPILFSSHPHPILSSSHPHPIPFCPHPHPHSIPIPILSSSPSPSHLHPHFVLIPILAPTSSCPHSHPHLIPISILNNLRTGTFKIPFSFTATLSGYLVLLLIHNYLFIPSFYSVTRIFCIHLSADFVPRRLQLVGLPETHREH